MNPKDQCSKFEAKTDEGFFLGYSSEAKAFRVFNISSKIVEESIHVTFDEDSYIQDRTDQRVSILNEMILSPYGTLSKTIVPNIDHIVNNSSNTDSQAFNSKDQVNAEEQDLDFVEQTNTKELVLGDPSNHRESYYDDNDNGNHRFLHDHIESQIIKTVNSGNLTRIKATSNFACSSIFFSMIKSKYD